MHGSSKNPSILPAIALVCAKYGPEMVVAQSLEEILGKGISVVNLN